MILLFFHGAGYTAETWCWLVDKLKESLALPLLQVAFDFRGHGRSKGDCVLSIDNLLLDASAVVRHYQEHHPKSAIFLVGHSLGGSVVTKLVAKGLISGVTGIVVIDIVEETALNALQHMPHVLATRPKTFPDATMATKWAVKTRNSKTEEIADISFLSQYRENPDGSFTMITDLLASQPHWQGWFQGLSEEFARLSCSRLLVLAETDYLDKPLLIGQMQGKFQLEIIRNTGHAIQEDQPEQLAHLIAAFIDRNMTVFKLNNK